MAREKILTSITPQPRPTGGLSQAGMMQIGSGLASLGQGFASLAAASAQARQFKIQRTFDDLAISNQKLKAQQQAIFLREKFFKDISSSRASFAGRGVALGTGIAARFATEAERVLQEDLKATELESRAIQGTLELRKSQAKLRQETARNLGLMRAGQTLTKGATSLLTGFTTIKT